MSETFDKSITYKFYVAKVIDVKYTIDAASIEQATEKWLNNDWLSMEEQGDDEIIKSVDVDGLDATDKFLTQP